MPPDATTTCSASTPSVAAADAGGAAVGHLDAGNFCVEERLQAGAARVRFERRQEALNDLVARAPDDVPPGDGVAGAINAALRPIDQRQEPDLLVVQKFEDGSPGIFAVVPGPLPRPVVIGAEIGDALPVPPGQFRGVFDLEAALVRRADHVYAAERLPGEAAEVFAPVLVDQQHAAAAIQELIGGHDTSQSTTGDDDFGLVCFGVGHDLRQYATAAVRMTGQGDCTGVF